MYCHLEYPSGGVAYNKDVLLCALFVYGTDFPTQQLSRYSNILSGLNLDFDFWNQGNGLMSPDVVCTIN